MNRSKMYTSPKFIEDNVLIFCDTSYQRAHFSFATGHFEMHHRLCNLDEHFPDICNMLVDIDYKCD